MITVDHEIKNTILAGLPHSEYSRLLPNLERTSLSPGEKLYTSGGAIEHVYFPSDGLVSLVTHMSDGTSVEVGIIGRDGMVGIPVLLGDDIAFEEAVVQIAGDAMRMTTGAFKESLKSDHNALLTLLLLYTRSLMKQVGRTAACNRIHSVDQRLSRWLLMCHDRMDSDGVPLTHEFISNVLGTRRASVTGAAASLQSGGLIRYTGGNIRILDRDGLEAASCECYKAAIA